MRILYVYIYITIWRCVHIVAWDFRLYNNECQPPIFLGAPRCSTYNDNRYGFTDLEFFLEFLINFFFGFFHCRYVSKNGRTVTTRVHISCDGQTCRGPLWSVHHHHHRDDEACKLYVNGAWTENVKIKKISRIFQEFRFMRYEM